MVAIVRLWIDALPPKRTPESLDRFFLYGPFQEHLGRQLAQGHLPGWNPWLGLGVNDALDVSLGPFYAPNALFAVLRVPQADAVLAFLHIAMAATAVCLLARRGALGLAGAAVGAAVAASGMVFNHLANYSSLLMTFCWLPVAFLAARRLADRPGLPAALVLAAVLAMQIFAGYLQVHLYTVLLLPLFFFPLARPSALVRPLTWAVAAELIALGLAAVTLVGLTAIAVSWRSREATPELLHHIFPVHLQDYLRGLATPAFTGAPVYGGPLLLPLVLAGFLAHGITPRLRIPAATLAVAAIVLSLGDQTPIFELLRRLPIGYIFTGPYKWTYYTGVASALLAAVGAHALLTRGALARAAADLWLVVSAGYLLWLSPPPGVAAVSLAVVCGLAIVQRNDVPRARAFMAAALAPIVIVTALSGYAWRSRTLDDPPDFFERYRPAYAFLRERQADGRTFILIPSTKISPRQGEIEGVAQFNTNGVIVTMRFADYVTEVGMGASGFKRGRALALLRALGARFIMTDHDGYSWLARAGLERVFTSPDADIWRDAHALPRVYLARAVEYVPAARVLARLRNLAIPENRTAVLEEEEGGGQGGTAGDARIVRSSDTEVVVSADAAEPGVLVLLDAWSPDWRAYVDGQRVPIRHANWLARAVEVPAGHHEVVFTFVPVTSYAGLAVSLATAFGCIAAITVRRRRAGARA